MKRNKKSLSCLILLCFVFSLVAVYAESASAMPGPIREWKFDEGEGTTAKDTSGENQDGKITGAQWVDGIKGKALQFAGSEDFVTAQAIFHAELANWSILAFIKPNSGTDEIAVYSEKAPELSEEEGKCYFYISITSDNAVKVSTWNRLRGECRDEYTTAPGIIERGKWNHLHVSLENGKTAKGSGTVKVYIDRELKGQGGLGTAFMGRGVVGAAYTVGTQTLERLIDARRLKEKTDFNSIYPWSEIKPYSAPDGTNMIKIPKFYYRRTYDAENSKHQFYVTDKPTVGFKLHPAFIRDDVVKPYVLVAPGKFGTNSTRATCRSTAQAKGDGWGIVDIQTWSAIQMLWLIEYAHTDSQAKLSTGNYRGMNGLYTNPGQWIDGINLNGYKVYIAEHNFEDNKFDGQYQNTLFQVPASGNIRNWHYSPDYDWLFLPSVTGSGIPDYVYTASSGSRVALAGYYYSYYYDSSANYGLFYCYLHYSSTYTYSGVGARLLYIP